MNRKTEGLASEPLGGSPSGPDPSQFEDRQITHTFTRCVVSASGLRIVSVCLIVGIQTDVQLG